MSARRWRERVQQAFTANPFVPQDEVLEELAEHAESMHDALLAAGAPDADQQVEAQILAWTREAERLRRPVRTRTAVSPPPETAPSALFGLWQDLRYALRLLARQPRHALLTILTIAIGIGATTFLFSLTYGVLLKPLPWPQAERLVTLKETRAGSPPRFGSFTNAAFLAWRERPQTLESLAAWSQRDATLSDGAEPERIRVVAASAALFQTVGMRTVSGSFFHRDDQPLVVISDALWRRRFNSDPNVLGRVVQLDGQPYTIAGIADSASAFPDREAAAWIPFAVPSASGNLISVFSAVARLKPGVTPAQAAAEGTARAVNAPDGGMTAVAIFGSTGAIEVSAVPLREALAGELRRPLLVLLLAVGLLLFAATANVANIQLARATTRAREMAIRTALGASGRRLVRQLLSENLLLGLAGGVAGIAAAWALLSTASALLPPEFPRAVSLSVDAAVVAFALAISLVASIAFGLLPALFASRLSLTDSLQQDGHTSVGGRATTRVAASAIMSAQVAAACVLLVGAALLGGTFVSLVRADRGFQPAGVVTGRVSLPSSLYAPERRYQLVEDILDRLAAAPGLDGVAFTSEMPLSPGGSTSSFQLRSPEKGAISVQASPRVVSRDYFSVAGIRIMRGRPFTADDRDAGLPVVVVNESFARTYLENEPLGAQLPRPAYGDASVMFTVIGVAEDVKYITAARPTQPEIYYLFGQMQGRLTIPVINLLVRSQADANFVGSQLAAIVRSADPQLVPEGIATLEDRLLRSLARPRMYALLLAMFAVFTLAVAAVGLYGLLTYMVAQRSRELAVRVALGARPVDIIGLVLRHGLLTTAAGLLVGTVASVAFGRSLRAMLYGIRAAEPAIFIGTVATLTLIAIIACLPAAVRAARQDPLKIMRT